MEANNVKAMREALEYIAHYCDSEYGMDDPGCADGHILADKAESALAEPPRNCDVGTVLEQAKRFAEFCHQHKHPESECLNCPLLFQAEGHCELAWAQMPYEKGIEE